MGVGGVGGKGQRLGENGWMSSDAADLAIGDHQVLVGISFPDLFRAQEFLSAAGRLASREELVLRDAVIVVKNSEGHTTVRETIDPQPGRSAFSGALWASLFGLMLGGPVGWVAGAAIGAGAGAVTAKIVDLGIPDEWVAWFREAVKPDTATVALLVSDLDRGALVAEVSRFAGAQLVYADLDETTLAQLRNALSSGPSSPAPETAPPASTPDASPEPEASSPESPSS